MTCDDHCRTDDTYTNNCRPTLEQLVEQPWRNLLFGGPPLGVDGVFYRMLTGACNAMQCDTMRCNTFVTAAPPFFFKAQRRGLHAKSTSPPHAGTQHSAPPHRRH